MKKRWLICTAMLAALCVGGSFQATATEADEWEEEQLANDNLHYDPETGIFYEGNTAGWDTDGEQYTEDEQYSDEGQYSETEHTDGDYYYDSDSGVYMESNDAGWDTQEEDIQQEYDVIAPDGTPGYITSPAGQNAALAGDYEQAEAAHYYLDAEGGLWVFDGYNDIYLGAATESYKKAFYMHQNDADQTGSSSEKASSEQSTDYSYYSENEDEGTQIVVSEDVVYEDNLEIKAHTYLSFPLTDDLKVLNFQVLDQKSYQEILGNSDGSVRVYIYRSEDGTLGNKDMKTDNFLSGIFKNTSEIQQSEAGWNSYPCRRVSYKTSLNDKEMNLEAMFVYTDTDYHCIVVLNAVGVQEGYADHIFETMKILDTKRFAGTRTVTSDDGVNIRMAPSVKADICGYLASGDTIDVYECTLDGWYQVYTTYEKTGKLIPAFIKSDYF